LEELRTQNDKAKIAKPGEIEGNNSVNKE